MPPNLRSIRVGPPAEYVRCRVLRHSWNVTGEVEHPTLGRLVSLQCEYCRTIRYDYWDLATGARLRAPSYHYEPEYADTEPGHDAEWYRKTLVDDLYRAGILKEPANPDTRRRA